MSGLRNIVLFCCISSVVLFGCHRNEPFTTEKWKSGDGLQFPLRNSILEDLTQHHQLKGMTYKQVQHLLSYPDNRDSAALYYQVIETYNNLGKRDHIKNLVLYMNKDSVITRFEIYEKTFKK